MIFNGRMLQQSEISTCDNVELERLTLKGKVFVLVIYDIVSDKRRSRFAKFLQGYGTRVQKSAFEALLTKQNYKKLMTELPKYVTLEDNIRLYKINGLDQVLSWGAETDLKTWEEILIV